MALAPPNSRGETAEAGGLTPGASWVEASAAAAGLTPGNSRGATAEAGGLTPGNSRPQDAGSGPAAYLAACLADTPWSLNAMQDASGALADASGNNRPLDAFNGAPDYQEDGPMGAGNFSIGFGNSEFAANDGTAPNVTDDFTLEMFVYLMGTGQDAWIWQCGIPGGGGFSIAIDSSDRIYPLANNVAVLTKGPVLAQTTWYHVAITRDTVWSLYVDGEVAVADAGSNAPAAPGDLNRIAGPIGRNLPLRLAYCAVYTTALSAERIAAHYAATGL